MPIEVGSQEQLQQGSDGYGRCTGAFADAPPGKLQLRGESPEHV